MIRQQSLQSVPKKKSFGLLRSIKASMAESSFQKSIVKSSDMPSSYLAYLDWVLERFNVNYYSSQHSRLNIPASGRVIIFVNHPVGSLDGLVLLHFVNEIRQDVKLVSMDLLTGNSQLADRVIHVKRKCLRRQRESIAEVLDALRQEKALIVFPAVKAARVRKSQLYERKWSHRFLKLAMHSNSPLLPISLENRVSRRPSFARENNKISVISRRQDYFLNVGEIIPAEAIKQCDDAGLRCRQLKKHLKRIDKGRPGIFRTQKAIVRPQSATALREDLANAKLLGKTFDDQQIYLLDYQDDSPLLQEIGRLREYTFRAVGEGTGLPIDLDGYDQTYRHIVLWNERRLEVVGAYRLAEAGQILQLQGVEGLYCNELFEMSEEFKKHLPYSIELGRSFVQPKYWGKRSLDYLWYGIGAFLKQNPGIRYLYGPVSISNAYPELVKRAIVRFYSSYFGAEKQLVKARRPYLIEGEGLEAGFCGSDFKEDFVRLKEYLNFFDVKVPTLYKQYSDVCEPGGVVFDAFSVDPNFGYCVDGLVRVDVRMIKKKKLQRYLGV